MAAKAEDGQQQQPFETDTCDDQREGIRLYRLSAAATAAQSSLPEHAAAGEQFKYVCKGAVVNWWGWGTKADNRDSMVEVLC
ncbi:Kinesin light [Apiospora marii]|uniref:Kinesin light n=1 Tax=Apiospora marii TaxID=335849 RepID=A0ABR1S4R8_9PEZI